MLVLIKAVLMEIIQTSGDLFDGFRWRAIKAGLEKDR